MRPDIEKEDAVNSKHQCLTQNTFSSNLKGQVLLYISAPSSCEKNQRPNQVNHPWYIPAVTNGKSNFGAPNCPVRALRYYHRSMTERPELRKDRRRLFVPI